MIGKMMTENAYLQRQHNRLPSQLQPVLSSAASKYDSRHSRVSFVVFQHRIIVIIISRTLRKRTVKTSRKNITPKSVQMFWRIERPKEIGT